MTTQSRNHSSQETPTIIHESNTIAIIEDSLLDVKRWMDGVRIRLNESKTEFIYFSSRQQLKKCTFDRININNEPIQRSDTVKYLGAYLDQSLNFKKHVNHQMQGSND